MSEQINTDLPIQKKEVPEGLELTARVAPLAKIALDLSEDDEVVPQRKETLHNQVFISDGGAKLLQPDQDLVEYLVASCDKLEYFGSAKTSKFIESKSRMMGDPEFNTLVFEPLIEEIKKSLPEIPVLTFRGGMASINGTFMHDYGHSSFIQDVTKFVENGGDREGVFNAATTRMDLPTTDISLNLHRVVQYAAGTGFRRYDIKMDAPEVAEALFPTVSVYDTSKLQKAGNANVWAVEPKEGYTASDVLIAAYILDCPEL
jgi:hypothetical protein